jgi:hypothetical protein
MTSALKATFLFAVIGFTASVAQAQNASLTHIFPQVVDGVASDGNVYTSRFLISSSSLSSPATCEISLFGIDAKRLSPRITIQVEGSSFETITTRGEDAIDTGYARLDCTQPVVASLTYSIVSATGAPLGIATTPSAPPAGVVLIPIVLNGHYRYGIALANDNDEPQVVAMLFDSGATSQVWTVPMQPRSQYVTFVDEIFKVPASGLGTLRIGAVPGGGPGNFHITSLLFDQGAFTNVVPTIYR